jgi:GT2 family glycosyltransferase
MITIIYSTHKDSNYNNNFKKHLQKTIGIKEYEILEFTNFNEHSLAEIYNKGISQSKYDIIVCCHNDIKLENNWGKKLLKDFENNPQFGIIGKAGSCYFPESGVYWERMNFTMVGQVYHHPQGMNKWLNTYSAKLPFLIPVVTIDGLFMSFDKTKIKHLFDESVGRFHFYDHSFCVPNYVDGVKIGVTSSFEITHESVGKPNQEFYESKDVFLKKYGHHLPLNLLPENIFINNNTFKEHKIKSKVAVIIPTKGNLNLLFDCLNSFIQNCNPNNFEVFVADTGSEISEKESIKQFISDKKEKVIIHFLEYDYYNFAKINNDVVNNHVDSKFDFLLFCNNDVKLLSNVVDNMLNVFKENNLAGTVGARLHFKDNTIQHNGISIFIDKNNKLQITHAGLHEYYTKIKDNQNVVGNTAALMMIRKNIFLKIGGFNEKYNDCLEDVELNLKCRLIGLKNILSSNSVAYHYESQSRQRNFENQMKFKNDYLLLQNFITENKNKIVNVLS